MYSTEPIYAVGMSSTDVGPERTAPQVAVELEYLGKTLEEAGDQLRRLEERLSAVCSEPKANDIAGEMRKSEPLCPLAGNVRNLRDGISGLRDRIQSLNNRLEI